MKAEYKFIDRGASAPEREAAVKTLNELGSQGWFFVGVIGNDIIMQRIRPDENSGAGEGRE